jgi:hypothetical protein
VQLVFRRPSLISKEIIFDFSEPITAEKWLLAKYSTIRSLDLGGSIQVFCGTDTAINDE